MSKVTILVLVAMIVAVSTVSAGAGCSKPGASCHISLGESTCCGVCNTRTFKCEGSIGSQPINTQPTKQGGKKPNKG